MAVHFKFKSAKDFDSVAIDGHFISVGNLKEKIFELKHLGRGTDFDLVVTNAQTNEEYLDEEKLISKNTSVLIRRVPGRPRKPIVTAPATEQEEPLVKNTANDVQVVKDSFTGAEPSTAKYAEELDWDEFGNDLYAIPEALPVQSSIAAQEATPVSKEDEDSKLKALIDTPALDWQHQPSDGFGTGRGFGRGMGGRAMGGRGFGRGGFEKKTPPEGYICYRCKVPGHFIQHCPTNGDPNYDIKRVRPPTGIPKSMLMATPDGSYALPSGAVAVLKPNDAAFEKEIEGMPSTRSVGELPPELHCPLCKEVMKDAVLTSKCCFNSFCDKCIRDYIISRSICVCGASNILADDLLPNKTVRDTISRILESNDSSAENAGSAFQVQDMESRNPQAKVPSPTQSAASRGQQVLAQPPQREEASKIAVSVEENQAANDLQKQEARSKVPDVSEATHDSTRVKAVQGGTLMVDEERKQKPTSGDAGRKKKKKVHMPPGAAEMHWRAAQGLGPENYMMPMGPSAFDPYWNGIQPGFEGFMPPYPGPMPYMGGYGFGPMDVGFGSVLPQDPYGGPGFMLPYGPPPHRDLAELAMGFNAGPPMMSREEFEARKADLKRKREMERHGERHSSKDRDFGREVSSKVDVSPMKPKSKSIPIPSGAEHYQNPRHQLERRLSPDNRSRDPELPRPSSKKNSDYDHYQDRHHHDEEDRRRRRHHHNDDDHHGHHHSSRGLQRRSESSAEPPAVVDRKHKATVPQPLRSMSPSDPLTAADKKHKASVFSRISFPDNKVVSSSSDVGRQKTAVPNGYHKGHKADLGSKRSSVAMATMDVDRDSSDDERHFKRRPSRYTSSPPPPPEMEESRPSRGSRDKDRDRDRGSYSKHR